MQFCDANGIAYQVVYTKKDKKIREQTQVELDHLAHPAMVPEILATSAEKKRGIEEIRAVIGIK